MGRINLFQLVKEENYNLDLHLQQIKERALGAEPYCFIKSEDVLKVLYMLDLQAKEFAEKHYKIIVENGFTEFLKITHPYIKAYLTEEDLKNMHTLFEWGLGTESEKEQILKIFKKAFIENRFLNIDVDEELFKSNEYKRNQGEKKFTIWEDTLKIVEFDNLEDYKTLYYFYHKKIRGEDMDTIYKNAPINIKRAETKVYEYIKQGLNVAKKYGLPLPKSFIEEKESIK